jgi:hypothetical protein
MAIREIPKDKFIRQTLRNARQRAAEREGVERKKCTVTEEYLTKLWNVQGGKCAITGHIMSRLAGHGNSSVLETNASIDRIDSNKGYVPGNVQWVCWRVNRMKGAMDYESFVQWCETVVNSVEYHGKIAPRIKAISA